MANPLFDGASKALGLPAAGAIFAALAGQIYLWSFGPYGWTQEKPVCPQVETCVVVAGLDGDVSYGFGAGGNVFGIDLNDDVTETLVSRLQVASGASPETTTFRKYTREITLPEAGDAREQERFFESLARAREIGVTSRARLVVMGRVVGDDVIIWFVDPNGSEAPRQADYSMTAPGAQQSLAQSYNAALVQVVQAEQGRAQAAAERERLAQQQQQEQQRQQRIQEQQARTQVAANVPSRQAAGPPPTRAATTVPPATQSGTPGMRAPPPSQSTTAASSGSARTSPSQTAPSSGNVRTTPQTQSPATQVPQQQQQPQRSTPASTPTPTPARPTPTPPASTPQTAVAMPDGPFVYRCTDDRILRVVFDSERRIATINQYGRAPTRLNLATGGTNFRFARSGYELTGTTTEVRWRIGSGDPMVCSRSSW